MEQVQARPEHEWLQQFVGEWQCEGEATMVPGEPPETFKASETVRSIGGVWIQGEGLSQMPDGSMGISQMTLGFDPQRNRFVGTFLGSMMTHLWIYDGRLDEERRVLTLDTEGPSPDAEGKMARFQDIIERVSADHRILSSRVLGDDGQWRHFMTAHYRRS